MKTNTRKIVIRVILACIVVSALSHWKDIKHGAIDGWNDGVSLTANK